MQIMNQKDIGIASLPKDLKQFVLDLTVNAVKNMDLSAGDDSPAYKDMNIDDEEDEFRRESVDLSNIRGDYGIEESKPDFLDIDKDGDEEESMKKAAKDKVKEGDDEDDDSWIPSEDEFDQEIEHGYKGRTTEGFSSEADQILAKCGSGELDCYDVMTNPKTPAEATAAKIIQQMYDDVSIDHHLHPDDDFEQILDIVADQLEADYGNSDADVREDDQIAEISDKTKDSYVKKASAEIGKHWDNSHDDADSARKYYNRKNTMRKISNEEVEGTAGNALDAAMLELRKLAGLR
jgi:hypothetical protein